MSKKCLNDTSFHMHETCTNCELQIRLYFFLHPKPPRKQGNTIFSFCLAQQIFLLFRKHVIKFFIGQACDDNLFNSSSMCLHQKSAEQVLDIFLRQEQEQPIQIMNHVLRKEWLFLCDILSTYGRGFMYVLRVWKSTIISWMF